MTTICLDCRYVKPRPSGIAAIVEQLVTYLPGLAPDIEFLFLRHSSLGRPLSDAQNVREIELSAEANSPPSMWFLPKLVDLGRIDLFHSPSNILPAGLRTRTITTVHDLMWLDNPDLCSESLWARLVERRFYAHGMERALRLSDRVLTVSEATRKAIIARDPDYATKTRAILPGVSATFRPAEGAGEQSIAPTRPYVLTVGQFAPYKNHEGAIRGFARAFANDSGIDMILVQRQGPRTSALKHLAEKLGIGERVHFRQTVDEGALVALYGQAVALLHPSFCEGFGMPIAEAMACGCPVITSDLFAMPEVAGGAALLVDPRNDEQIASALRRVMHEEGLAEKMARAGLDRAKQLSWQAFAKAHVAVYRELLQQN